MVLNESGGEDKGCPIALFYGYWSALALPTTTGCESGSGVFAGY